MAGSVQGARGLNGDENQFQPNNEPKPFAHLETYAGVQKIREHYYAVEVLGILLEYLKKGTSIIDASLEEIAELRNYHLRQALYSLTQVFRDMETELDQNVKSVEKLEDENKNRKDDDLEHLAGRGKKRKLEEVAPSVDTQLTKRKRKGLQNLQQDNLAKDYEGLTDDGLQNILDLQSGDLRAQKVSTQDAEENPADSFSTSPKEPHQYSVPNPSLNLVGENYADKKT